MCIGLAAGCAQEAMNDGDDPLALVRELRNSDVRWDGTPFGLMPAVEGDAAKRLMSLGEPAAPVLREALDGPDKFAAAHVLLTFIEKTQWELSSSHWNGLRVDLYADGTTDLHPEQINEIVAMWQTGPAERTLAVLEEMLSPDLTHEEVIAAWGEPDARGSGRDLLDYKLNDGSTVRFFYIGRKLVGVSHDGQILAEYPRPE